MRIRENKTERVELTEEECILVMMCEDTGSKYHSELMRWCKRRGFVPGHVEVSRETERSEVVSIGIRKHPEEREMTPDEEMAYHILEAIRICKSKDECADGCPMYTGICAFGGLSMIECNKLMEGKEVIE